MPSETVSDTSLASLDAYFLLDDGLRGGMRHAPKYHGSNNGQDLVIDPENQSPPMDPSSISRLCIERGEYPAVALSFKYLSGAVNDHHNWVSHELSDPEIRRVLNQAKIFPAVLISGLCTVNKDLAMLRHIVRRWSSETHTFVSLWGEFTPTLEDVANIMGLPIVGSIDPSKIQLSMQDVEKLLILKGAKDCFAPWVKHFWGSIKEDGDNRILKKGPGYSSGCRLEALLSLWLSKFVFSDGKDSIQERVFPLAILMSKGETIPLAPMFLGHLYQALDLIVMQEKEKASSHVVESCVSTTFLQMFIWERLKDSSVKPTPLATFKKKELTGFKLESLPLMCRWLKRVISRDVSDFLGYLDDEARFKFRPYADLVDEVPLKLMCEECNGPSGVIAIKNDGKVPFLDAYLVTKSMALPVLSDNVKSDEKIKISFVSYFPHRVRHQFGFDQGIPVCPESSDDACDYIQLFSGKLDVLGEGTSVMLASSMRVGYKSETFHNYWLGVLSGFKDYVESGGHDSRTRVPKLSDSIESSIRGDLEMERNTDGKRTLVIEGEDSGTKDSTWKKRGDRCKNRKIRPRVLKEVSKRDVENSGQAKEKTTVISSSIFTTSHRRTLLPRESPNTIPSSDDDDNDDDNDDGDDEASLLDEERGQSGHGSSHKEKDAHVDVSPVPPVGSSGKEIERPTFQPRRQISLGFALHANSSKRVDDGFGIGSGSSGIPKAPLFVAPMFPTHKLEELPPQVKDFVYWSARFEGSEKVLDSIEKLHPLAYSEDNLLPFHDMYVCPKVFAPLTKFFGKYGNMSQLDRFKCCMIDTKSGIFERLRLVLLSMEKTSTMHLTLDDILEWRDVVRDLMCVGVPISFLLDHLRKLVRVCYFLKCGLSQNVIEYMGEIRCLEDSAESIYKKIGVAQAKLRDLLSHDPSFPTDYSDFVVESTSGIGCSALLGLYDCRP